MTPPPAPITWSPDQLVQLKNLRVVKRGRAELVREDLMIRNGRVCDPEKVFFDEKRLPDVILDCHGLVASPGLIDVQLNGAYGRDFTNEHAQIDDALVYVSERIVRHGVTAYCPTVITSPPELYETLFGRFKSAMEANNEGSKRSRVLGLHLEGPFISKGKKGAHDEHLIRSFDSEEGSDALSTLQRVYGKQSVEKLAECTRIITLAPELDTTGEIVRTLAQHGICVSVGHSLASLSLGERAVVNGARFITHLFNAMLPFHHRDPHLIGLISERNTYEVYFGIIADSIHTHPSALAISYRTRPHGLCLVTDAISPMGLAQLGSQHHIGNQWVEIKRDNERNANMACLRGTDTLCGSIATMIDCVRGLIDATGCSLVEALRCASEHPARLLHRYPDLGALEPNSLADIVLMDDAANPKATFVGGNLVWQDADFKFKVIKSA